MFEHRLYVPMNEPRLCYSPVEETSTVSVEGYGGRSRFSSHASPLLEACTYQDATDVNHTSTWEEVDSFARMQDAEGRQPGGCCCQFPWFCEHEMPPAQKPPGPLPHVCFMVNLKSGVGIGATLSEALGNIEDITVIDLQALCHTPAVLNGEVLRVIQAHHAAEGIRIVAAGGDGTVTWVASLIEEACESLKIDKVTMAVLPCGVGNEVSRCTGFGASFGASSFGGSSLENFVVDVMTGPTVMLDTWTVTITEEDGTVQEKHSVCFLSAGFDAAVALRFHEMRDRSGSKPISNTMNKLAHVWYGVVDSVESNNYVQGGCMDLKVDGITIELPPNINTVQIMSLPSSADGNDFFGLGQKSRPHEMQQYSYPNFGDGLLEVVGTRGIGEILAIRTGATHSHRIAQGVRAELTLRKPTPIQLDGEPWLQAPCTISIAPRSKIPVVIGRGSTRGAGLRRQSRSESRSVANESNP